VDPEFGLGVRTNLDFDVAVMRARMSLRVHGFSILSEMPAPVGIGEEAGRRHLFMAVWEKLITTGNLGGPGMDVGDHLSCNVVVFQEGDKAVVAALDPTEDLEGWVEGMREAEAAREALQRALTHLVKATGGPGLSLPIV
jgi:hypothetical protein